MFLTACQNLHVYARGATSRVCWYITTRMQSVASQEEFARKKIVVYARHWPQMPNEQGAELDSDMQHRFEKTVDDMPPNVTWKFVS